MKAPAREKETKARVDRCARRNKIVLIFVRADGDAGLLYPTITRIVPWISGAYFLLRRGVWPFSTCEVARNEPPEAVWIHSCPEFDAYLSGNDKWKLKGEFAETVRTLLLVMAFAQIKTTSDNEAATWVEQARRRIGHAIAFRSNPMLASISTRKRPRGDNEKQKIADLREELLTRLFVTKKSLPEHFVNLALRSGNKRLLARLVSAHVRGVNPLLDDVDLLSLTCWDQLGPIFLRPFYCFAYVHKDLPGLIKWREAAAAIFIAFVEENESFYSLEARPTDEHPNRRPYQTYRARRKNLDLHPHKRPVITGAIWDKERDVLHLASEADGWAWEIYRFMPTPADKPRSIGSA
jgi:hypothetical protein